MAHGACAEPSLSDVAAEVEGEDLDEFSANAAAVELAALQLSLSGSSGSIDATSFADNDVESEWSTDDADIQRAHAAQQRARAPRLNEAQLTELRAEGDAKGYGRMYAAMGGGREGLEACAAGDALLQPRQPCCPLIDGAYMQSRCLPFEDNILCRHCLQFSMRAAS